tara:strand:+ start:162 stop:380 length:219 start_codon:yes stop_codon:yes gene_type:complete
MSNTENTHEEDKSPEQRKRQMKIFLTHPEHTIVVLAANAKDLSIREYMKRAVLSQAKSDALEIDVTAIVDSI